MPVPVKTLLRGAAVTTLATAVAAHPAAATSAVNSPIPAVRYALAQVGKPYQRGATGPGSYDCSGLTYRAWAHAGVRIPRTSGQQWNRLPRIPLSRLIPGDIVVYYPQASHVALYVGGGTVIQATHPGARVQYAPLNAQPILGAVRA